ncbi:MAG: hypothetical protein EOP89_10875, partial [Lysobacteraceae bacterium]
MRIARHMKANAMDRRTFVVSSATAGSLVLLGSSGPVSARASARFPVLIDGNLVAPIDASTPMDPTTRAQVRSSGLTAFKQTLGGSGNQSKAETDVEIAEFLKAVSLNANAFAIVENAAALAQPQIDGKIGIILSFEAGEMLEGQLDNIDHFRRSGVLVMGLSYNRTTPFGSGT